MTRARLLVVLLLIPMLPGCDIALAVYFGTKKSSSSNSPSVPLPAISIVATDAQASEAGGNTGTFTITRTGSTAAALDVFFTVSGTATSVSDFDALTSPVTIPAGSLTATLTVTPVNDGSPEGATPETVIVTVTATANYTVDAPGFATVNIDDDDDDRYHVWVANLTAGQASAEEATLTGNGGNPAGPPWTEVTPVLGKQTTTAEFVPPPGMNTIMIQINNVQQYEIDGIELLDAPGNVVTGWASGTIYQARMSTTPPSALANYLGTPDGLFVASAATAGNKAVIFTQFTGLLERFRVNIWKPGAPGSGDVVWATTASLGNDQICGGIAVHSNGTTYLGFHDDVTPTHSAFVMTLSSNGTASAPTTIANAISVSPNIGAVSVAIDELAPLPANHFVYVAATIGPGNIGMEKYSLALGDTTSGAGNFFFSTGFAGVERVEANALAVDGAGNVIIAGGIASILGDIDFWMMKLSSAGAQLWGVAPGGPVDLGDSWWHAVAVDGGNNLFGSGNVNSGGSLDILSQRVTSGGSAGTSVTQANPSQPDLAHAVAVDRSAGANDEYLVGGYQTVAGKKEGILYRYTNAGAPIASPYPLRLIGSADDEILDIAVDPADGAIFAVGYETVTGQGRNWWIRKYTQAGVIAWTRTHHHAGAIAGDDRAVSVAIQGNFIVVAGEVTLGGGGKDIHVRKYVK